MLCLEMHLSCSPQVHCDCGPHLHGNPMIDLNLSHLSWVQVAGVGGHEDGGREGCVPGFQVKHYQVPQDGPFQKGQVLIQGQ